MTTQALAGLALAAAGGRDRWRRATAVRGRLNMRGPTWDRVGQPTLLDGIDIEVDLREQRTVFTGFTGPGRRGIYTPHRVTVEDPDGGLLRERDNPRQASLSHDERTHWDELHALYFAGYGMWNYLSSPYLLTWPGIETGELEPVEVNGEPLRRLQVRFPDSIPTHSSPQIWYYTESGLLRRLDYAPAVLGGRLAAHHTEAHRTVSGLVFPTHRYVLRRFADGGLGADPVIIVDFSDLSVEFEENHDEQPPVRAAEVR